MKNSIVLFFFIILLVAAAFRFTGINWDAHQHLHPDERFLTMVANGISWPKTLTQYLDTATSPLNPHNAGFDFFVYGTFPLFLVKAIAELLHKGDYNNLTLVGRAMSGFFDLGTLVLVFLITKQIVKSKAQMTNVIAPYIAMFLYGAMVLPIQLSHFFTVDPYVTFFITLSFFFLTSHTSAPLSAGFSLLTSFFLGLSFGLAIASKISALLFLPIIALAFIQWRITGQKITRLLLLGFLFLAASYLTVRIAQPYLFATGNIVNPTLNPRVLANWRQLKTFNDPNGWFPPAVQWIRTKPIVYPAINMVLWGLGLPLGLLVAAAVIWTVGNVRKNPRLLLLLSWTLLLFLYQGVQFAKPMRYFYPVYPMLAVAAGLFAAHILLLIQKRFSHSLIRLFAYSFIGLLLIWPLSFLSVYLRPNTRTAASQWIYNNIPKGATIAVEHWDDPLPLCLPNKPCNQYQMVTLPLYDPDTPQKWERINALLATSDYLILSSNRLYGSIMGVPEKYPQTNRFYQSLFDGSLGFTNIAQFTSRPNLPIPFLSVCLEVPANSYGIIAKPLEECSGQGVNIVDDYAEESFTVYDHPRVIIFQTRAL